ncbi:MAG: homoserine kinase [Gemmatimonadaceae bacterium]
MNAPISEYASVRVPATTSNLGAGFDHVGVAIDKWLRVSVELRTDTRDDRGLVTIHRTGTLTELDQRDGGPLPAHMDLICLSFNDIVQRWNRGNGFNGSVHFEANSDIPIGKGLGSSAAAHLAGAALANAALGCGLTTQEIAGLGARMDGHGDNVGAAAFGGAVLMASDDEGEYFVPLPVHESLGFAFAVPDFETRTAAARAVLPPFIKFTDAVAAAARSAALIRGLQTGDARLLAAGFDDVLHVPYRKHFNRHYDCVVEAARSAGAFGATLSGSGSSIVAVASRSIAPRVAEFMAEAWGLLGVDACGFATGACLAGLNVVSSTYPPTDLSPYESAQPIRLPRSIACP